MQSGLNLLPQNILVAVDGSENSLKAVRMAIQIANNTKTKLTILHIAAITSTNYRGGIIPTMAKTIDKTREDARREGERIVSEAASLAEQEGVKAKTVVEESVDSTKGITDYAEKNMIDLIVVGSRGMSGLKRLLLGSVASSVVQHARCSVLVIR